METKICSQCKRELPLTEFYSRGNGKLRSECKACHNQYVQSQYQKRKSIVANIKTQYSCQKCGENRSYVLDFHHKDPSQKKTTIARMTSNYNHIEDIQNEIDKCIVLCANCHREFHYLNQREGISLEDYLEV